VRKRLSSQQWKKAKIIPKPLVKMALISKAIFYPMAFSMVLIFLATLDANLPTSMESNQATYCSRRV